jgi:hypothetical protein
MKKLLISIFATALLLTGCNKSDTASTNDGPGRLSVRITDDPFNISSVESATVTITKIEIRKAGANEGDPFLELLTEPVTIDLFQLRNGITEELVDLEVPRGDYDLVRLYVDDANLKIKDIATPFNMKVPSGEQTGIKVFINPVIHVEGGISAELLLDFDLSRSFVMRGKMAQNGFIFKPCIRAANNSVAGRIEGFVRDSSMMKVASASVWVQQDTVIMTTFTDTLGHYAFIGIAPGTYSMFSTYENYDTASVHEVKVYSGNRTIQEFVLNEKESE